MSLPLNFKIIGSGDPIIILHGFMGSLDNWQTFAKVLAERYMVITVDQRNHGKSPHDDGFTYDLMVEDLKMLMESEWIHQAHLLGHSMGGKVAMKFALNYPDMVEKLIVADIAPKQYPPGHHDVLEAMNKVPIAQLSSRKEAEEAMSDLLKDPGVRLFLLKNLKRTPEGFTWKVNLPVLTDKYPSILEEINGGSFEEDTLFIRGDRSGYIKDDDMDLISEIFPTAELATIVDAGHWIHADQPVQLQNVVQQFLEK